MTAAPPLYSAWLFDPVGNTLKPVIAPVENTMIQDVVSLQPRTPPAFIADGSATVQLAADGLGILDIRSVYDWDGVRNRRRGWRHRRHGAAPGKPARRALPAHREAGVARRPGPERRLPRLRRRSALDDRNFMREILGYVPIEPDGSVRVKVPANVAFRIAILDANARRIAPEPHAPGCSCARAKCWPATAATRAAPAARTVAPTCGPPTAPSPRSGAAPAPRRRVPGTGASSAIRPNCAGETMAQARYGLNCNADGTPDVSDATATRRPRRA